MRMLLQTLAPGSVGFQCAQRLSEIEARLKGYENLIRFDASGRFACAVEITAADASDRDPCPRCADERRVCTPRERREEYLALGRSAKGCPSLGSKRDRFYYRGMCVSENRSTPGLDVVEEHVPIDVGHICAGA